MRRPMGKFLFGFSLVVSEMGMGTLWPVDEYHAFANHSLHVSWGHPVREGVLMSKESRGTRVQYKLTQTIGGLPFRTIPIGSKLFNSLYIQLNSLYRKNRKLPSKACLVPGKIVLESGLMKHSLLPLCLGSKVNGSNQEIKFWMDTIRISFDRE